MYRDKRMYNDKDKKGKTERRNGNADGNNNDNVFRDPDAPVHVVNAVGGNNEGMDILSLEGGPNTHPDFRLAPWSAFRYGT